MAGRARRHGASRDRSAPLPQQRLQLQRLAVIPRLSASLARPLDASVIRDKISETPQSYLISYRSVMFMFMWVPQTE